MSHRHARRTAAPLAIAFALVLAAVAPGAHAAPGGKASGTGGSCNPKKAVCTTDEVAPTIGISAPADGAEVTGTLTVTGTAADDRQLSQIDVRVDDGSWRTASGTSAWSTVVEAPTTPGTAFRVTGRAVDANGNVATTSVDLVVASPTEDPEQPPPPPEEPDQPVATADWVLADPGAAHALLPLGRTRLPQWGELTGVLYTEQFTNRRAIAFRDRSTGATSYVDLPTDSLAGWTAAATVMTSPSDLWVFGGTGPMHVRRYRLQGSPLPSSATLLEQRVLGDGDSRPGDMTVLASGGLVVTWLQHGATGPQGQHVSYRAPDGGWQDLPALTFIPTKSSDQVVGQHPQDGSIWLFSNPDAWGAIGAAHLTETATGLRVDWTDDTYLSTTRHGLHGPDPENPDLALAVDTTRGSMLLAYQSSDRQRFTTSDGRSAIGSRIAVASVGTAGVTSFLVAPVWAERVSDVGLVAHDGDVVVTHRPLDPVTLSFADAHAIRHRGAAWEEQTVLIGTVAGSEPVTHASGRPEVSTRLADGHIVLRPV